MSLNVGLSSSVTASLCVGLNAHEGAAAPAGPTLLADFDFSAPATSWTTGRDDFTSAYATHEWILDGPTAGSYSANVGTATLTNTGGFEDQAAVGLWNGSSYTAVNAWEGLDDNDYLTCSDTTVGDAGDGNICVRMVFRASDFTNGDHVVTKYDYTTGTVGWWVKVSSGGVPYVVIDDNTTQDSVFLATNHCDGAWHYITFWWNEATNTMAIKSDLDGEVTSTSAVTAFTTSTALAVNRRDGGGGTGLHQQVAYLGVCDGVNSESMYDETFWQHASDPTALLTTQTRASLISVPVSATQVAHFSDDQLPIGYNGNFSDTDKLGLYCNSAVTNLITESEALSNWTSSNMTETDNFGDAPDGFRSATKLAATADNGYSAETFTTTAATEYTLSCYVREITVGCTGRVIFYDETGASELASQVFTCTSSDQLISVTATTNAGQVSSSMRIEIDTNTEECYAWGCQANLGNARGAYIRTSGSSAVLAQPVNQALGTAGEFSTNDTGECELTLVRSIKPLTTNTVVEGHGNDSRIGAFRVTLDTVDRFDVGIDNSAGTNGVSVNNVTSGISNDTEYTVIVRWDDGAELGTGNSCDVLVDAVLDKSGTDTYTSDNAATAINIGSNRSDTLGMNGFVQRVRTWDGENG